MNGFGRVMILGLLTASLQPVEPVSGGPPLTHEAKKAIVYRMYADYRKDFPHVPDIAPRKAMELYASGLAVFVDTRKPAEMAVSRLPGAISQEEYLIDPFRYAHQTVIAYCTISYRSGIFAERMKKNGITIHNLAGGILAWVLEEGKIYDDAGETRRIHVYGEKWNYPPEGYTSVMFGVVDRFF